MLQLIFLKGLQLLSHASTALFSLKHTCNYFWQILLPVFVIKKMDICSFCASVQETWFSEYTGNPFLGVGALCLDFVVKTEGIGFDKIIHIVDAQSCDSGWDHKFSLLIIWMWDPGFLLYYWNKGCENFKYVESSLKLIV